MQATQTRQRAPGRALDAQVATILGWTDVTYCRDFRGRSHDYYGRHPDGNFWYFVPAYSTTWAYMGDCLDWCQRQDPSIAIEMQLTPEHGATVRLAWGAVAAQERDAVYENGVTLPHAVARAIIRIQQKRTEEN